MAALELATTFHPTSRFWDIGLPVMDGYELWQATRQGATRSSVQIAVTGSASTPIAAARAGRLRHRLSADELNALLPPASSRVTDVPSPSSPNEPRSRAWASASI